MIAPLARWIEWAFVQHSFKRMPHPDGNLGLDDAIQFLNGPDFMPAESQPAQIALDSASDFHFSTPRPGPFAENNVAYGRLYRCAERWRERPAIILLHGRNVANSYRFILPRIAHRCERAGHNAATLVLPFHFQRCPQQLKGMGRIGLYANSGSDRPGDCRNPSFDGLAVEGRLPCGGAVRYFHGWALCGMGGIL